METAMLFVVLALFILGLLAAVWSLLAGILIICAGLAVSVTVAARR